jgi:hypothetical protein
MDDLVRDLQREVASMLVPLSQRNDPHAQKQATMRQLIASTWYTWAQELYCDAVGLVMGGPCFFQAFHSFLLGEFSRGDFYRAPIDLTGSNHPVTWLRIRFLADRARTAGMGELAGSIEAQWQSIAREMRVVEEYHGYFVEALAVPIAQTIDEMLVEAAPRACLPDEATAGNWDPAGDTLVRLLNWAWQVRQDAEGAFAEWQSTQVARLIGDA